MNRQQRRAAAKRGQVPGAAPADAGFIEAVRLHQAGRVAEAADGYRRVLALDPQRADVLFNLAVALRQQGRLDEAVATYRRTVAVKPDYADAHFNLGNVLMALGRAGEASDAYRAAVAAKPDFARAYGNLGVALKEQGRREEAVAAYRQAVTLAPDYAEAHASLGHLLSDLGRRDEAIAAYRDAIRLQPGHAEAHCNLGTLLFEQGAHAEAAAAYARAIAAKPDYAEAHYNLGNLLKAQGRRDEAAAAYRAALTHKPSLAEAQANLGNVLGELGRLDEAVAAYRAALALKPDSAEAHYNLGNALKDGGALHAAAAEYRAALALKPDYAEAHGNLGVVLTGQGKIGEALAAYARAAALKPDDAAACSNWLMALNYAEDKTADEVFAAHRQWDARFGAAAPRPAAYANDCAPERRLKVGYVSPDLRAHSVAYFVEPLLQAHDRQAVEVFCYAEVAKPDAVTARLRHLADQWVDTVGMTDDALAARIVADGIDLLVDLAGHTAHNRLAVLARKPAPVQVTWLGYANTTGLSAIDARLVDAVTDPEGADAFASERLVRLAGGFLCYGGPTDAPEPAPSPCLANGTVSFGSFNNPAKLSDATLDVWAALLTRLPQARLVLKGKPFADTATRDLYHARFAARGVAAERVEMGGWVSADDHLAQYARVDIALDPFPYNGTTTTCEALWMGVPVVTLKGDRHAGRVGASLLTQIGTEEWIASSVDDYVAIAASLAEYPERLSALRGGLRARVAASALCDRAAFARQIEGAYRDLWQSWCANPC
jgi:predicted O-linked N-acetylglucosamine transferase (SPINDLY family)